eukprot:TRINITY_DN3081_c0_g1_i1.p1 TRINITY_DN3081_c0_g1~~TRINITY_DN3081_c0_g1_i1.p1  ORF type:complete len:368 (+),score=147.08 TRINITY_DN3081_c0_g1_i1:28-1104(+)
MPSTIHQILFLVVCLLAFSSYASSAASTTVNYNPWYFSERLAMYQLLLDRTTIPTLHTPSGNPLWGLPIQFDWQNESGRLPKDSSSTSHPLTGEKKIRYDSWWASMNYYLAVIPFLGAAQSGILGNTQYVIAPPSSAYSNLFCTTYNTCPQALMAKWVQYFNLVAQLRSSQSTNPDDLLNLQAVLWDAHIVSIETAFALFEPALPNLVLPERRFGKNWSLFVDFIAAANFPTSYDGIIFLTPLLPHRSLLWFDVPGFILDMNANQNRALVFLQILYDLQNASGGFLLTFFRQANTTPAAQADSRELLANAIQNPVIIFGGVITLIQNALLASIPGSQRHVELTGLLAQTSLAWFRFGG